MPAYKNGISIIIPISSADKLPYLENVLLSIDKQSYQGPKEVILSYCVNKSQFDKTDFAVVAGFGAAHGVKTTKLTFYGTPLYSLSLGRNAGVRKSSYKVIGFLDCDLVLDPRLLGYVERYILRNVTHCVCAHCYRMPFGPSHPIFRELRPDQFSKNLEHGIKDIHGRGGGCFFIDKRLFERLGGYDERFYGWGYEDIDMLERLRKEQIKIAYLVSDNIYAMHQQHPENTWSNEALMNRNKKLVYSTPDTKRNPHGWGKGIS